MSTNQAAIIASIGLALLLNAGAVSVIDQLSSHRHSAASGANDSVGRSTMVLLSTLTAAPKTVANPTPTPTSTTGAVAAPAAVPASMVSIPGRSPPLIQPARAMSSAPPGDVPDPVRFYTFSEVDSPAAPDSDWNLDVGALDAIGLRRLVFEVLVSDRGEIVDCTILDPSELDDNVRLGLEQRLRETSVQPAQRAGRFVASVRRIELFVSLAQ